MRILADTHILLWWLMDDGQLSERHREVLGDAANLVGFSAISIAEIAIKESIGRLKVGVDITRYLRDQGFLELEFASEHARQLRDLPWIHRDPFDRMLIAQAQVEDVALMTVDQRIPKYDVRIV
ncbi:type II toxin-antitoxin system VapC family toxin [Promicromonospora sp. CA-289599]|uniref:type II toxin-antitoxin system VapC family toxin n=1 Tax=Promicromonospora sp. CA-289599 TaxID=3240014 RepID=UPI003D8DD180